MNTQTRKRITVTALVVIAVVLCIALPPLGIALIVGLIGYGIFRTGRLGTKGIRRIVK